MAAEKKQITRTRTSYSCQTCRRRKVRCDKQHPRCGGCVKADEVCVYGDAEKSSLDTAESSELPTVTSARKRRATSDDVTHNGDTQTPSTAIQSIERKLNRLTTLVHDINRLTPISMGNSPDAGRMVSFSSVSHNGTIADQAYRTSSQTHEVSSSIGNESDQASPIENVLGKLDQLNSLLSASISAQRSLAGREPIERARSEFRKAQSIDESSTQIHHGFEAASLARDHEARIRHGAAMGDTIAPSQEESAVLFRSWLWSTYPILPIISPRIAWRKYQAYHEWYRNGLDKGKPNPDPGFTPYITFIWYTGFAALTDKAKEKWFAWADSDTWTHALRARFEIELEVMQVEAMPSIYSLAASVSGQYLAVNGQDIMGNHTRNVLNIRVAQSLGLHSERSLKGLAISDAETKRRLWWEAMSLDTSISTISGMPIVFDDRYTDTKIPSELKDSCMGSEDAMEYETHLQEPGSSPDRPDDPMNWQTSSLVSVHHLVARARHILTVATRKVLKANMSASPMTMDELKEVRKSMQIVGEEIRAIINRIQARGIPELDFVPDLAPPAEVDHLDPMGEDITSEEMDYFLREDTIMKSTTPILKHHRSMTIAFHKWARIVLSMNLDRLDCISYAPFLKNSKSRLWSVARNCALKSCHGYMRKFLCLAEDPELRMFRMAWASSFHPMHAIIIMLIDVHDRPHSDEAARSRAMIDKMFHLVSLPKLMEYSQCGPKKVLPLKEGGEEAWTMLRKLRHKAWQNAGLDPDVLWTEEDQTSVGIGKPLRENDLFVRSLREDIILKHKQIRGRDDRQRSRRGSSRYSGPAYEDFKNQRLHPSEVGQGDQVSGSVVRDMADLGDMNMPPQILLLRARNDQELMPYPATSRNTEGLQSQRQDSCFKFKEMPQHGKDGVQILHIGELIQKIQQTKRGGISDKSTPVPQMYSSLASQPLPSGRTASDSAHCDFRTLRSVENAAYQDIFEEKHSGELMMPTTDVAMQASPANVENAPTYTFYPDTSPRCESNNVGTNAEDQSLVLKDQTFMNVDGNEQSSSISSMPPSNPALGYFQPMPLDPIQGHNIQTVVKRQQYQLDQQEHPTYPPDSQLDLSQLTLLQQGNPTANDAVDTGTGMDVEFDWNRWDELFGQYAGFGDVLMDSQGFEMGEESYGYAFGHF